MCSSTIPYKLAATGHVGLAGPNLFDTTGECTTETENFDIHRERCDIRPAELGIPEQISRAGRRGDRSKKVMSTLQAKNWRT